MRDEVENGAADQPGALKADEQDEERLGATAALAQRPGSEDQTGSSGERARSESAERSDGELIRAARAGSHPAFEALVRRYSERAYRAAYRVVRDPHQSEEIVQEALIKAYRGLRSFEARSSFYTWLYRIVVNLALDRRRRERRAPSLEWDDTAAPQIDPRAVVPPPGDPELSARRNQVRELVASGVQELPDGQREVLLLREVEGLSYEEIAETMRISKGTVMSRLHYARKKMIAFLRQKGVDPEDAR